MQVYFTHNNGGRPYKVEIYQTNPVKIFQLADDEDDEDDENKSRHAEDDGDDDEVKYTYAMETKAEKIFVGESRRNEMTEFGCGYGDDFKGNSILLKKDKNRYQFIGGKVFDFTTYGEIVEFESPVGNNDVPYPHAKDDLGNIYLLTARVVLLKDSGNDLPQRIPKNIYLSDNKSNPRTLNDLKQKYPYYYYYLVRVITHEGDEIPIIKNFKGIKTWYVGDTKYRLVFNLFGREREEPMFIKYQNGIKEKLTKRKHAELMAEFAKIIKVKKLKNYKQILRYDDARAIGEI